ncbi:MAG: CARDB domain-containing protein [Candidatus Eisenbacteria bacterium]
MKRHAEVFAAACLCSFALATPVRALPDYLPFALPGWSTPLVVRTTGDATTGSAVNSPALTGGGSSWFSAAIANTGATAGLAGSLAAVQVDGSTYLTFTVPALSTGTAAVGMNQSVVVEGGLHTVSAIADATGLVGESNEANNVHARQLAFTPVNLSVGTQATRNAPPEPAGGTAAVSGAVYPNMDGVRLPADAQPWDAVAMRPPSGSDYDLYFYDATTGTGNGFRTPTMQSLFGAGATDFVLNNGNFVGAPAHDVGVLYYDGPLQSYGIEHRNGALTLSRPTQLANVPLAAEQMLWVAQYQHIPSFTVPRVLFRLASAPGTVLHVALFDPAAGPLYARNNASAQVATDATGKAQLDIALPTSGSNLYYGIVVFRDQFDGGTAATTFHLDVIATPADLANDQRLGWTPPINATNHGADLSNLPTALDGNTPNTTVSWYLGNYGYQPAVNVERRVSLDGVQISSARSTMAPFDTLSSYLPGVTVRGGRHTLSYTLDPSNEIDEIQETNNTYGKQFVWSPLAMSPGTPLVRPMPPEPTGGHDAIPVSVPRYANVDGLRVAFAPQDALLVTALSPAAGTDVDLEWFPLSTGPDDGFTTPLVSSTRVAGLTDLLVDCPSLGQSRQYDIGAVRYSGPNLSYTIQSLLGGMANLGATHNLGPGSIPAGSIVYARWFPAQTPSPTVIALENISGDADLGLSVFAFTPAGLANMSGCLPGGYADSGGPGRGEVATVGGIAAFDEVAVVVWKAGDADIPRSANFKVWVNPVFTDAGDVLPQELAFALTSDNPAHGDAHLRFALPTARDVTVDLLDVSGRRVRTLASGRYEAGAHVLAWDGRDDQGRALANGAYFARFVSHGERRNVRVVLLR